MSRSLIVKPVPLPEPPNSLVAVDRAVAEVRRGGFVVIDGDDGKAALMAAAEGISGEALLRLAKLAGSTPIAALTGRRAVVLGLTERAGPVALVSGNGPLTPLQIAGLTDPFDSLKSDPAVTLISGTPPAWAEGAVILAKLARMLPAAIVAPIDEAPDGYFRVAATDILVYHATAAHSLKRVAEARIPLANAEDARVVAFRPPDGGIEHLAIVIGKPDRDQPVLTRLHSECFTGDLLGSLRCDCGDQLRGAIAELATHGGGVLLYLAQEGRGIGLINKLRAYELQDIGFDTLDANEQLGFDDDERTYLPAAEMLRLLGVARVRLLTNNPRKVEGLARHGVQVVERVPHAFPSNNHNARYLRTKKTRSGHLF
jgi:GTP cyclohydrolase II